MPLNAEARSRGGKAARGERKAVGARAATAARVARIQALRELLEVARELGAFLDDLDCHDPRQEERRRELSDRLYTAVTKAKCRPRKAMRRPVR